MTEKIRKEIRPDRSKMKFLNCEITFDLDTIQKSADGSTIIAGFANTTSKDRVDEKILASAFAKSLPIYMDNPVLLFQHNWDMVIGKVIFSEIRTKGLFVKCKISNASDVKDIKQKIDEGILTTFSIGYNELESDFDNETKTKIVKLIELLEISVVTIPCNTEAKFSKVEDESESKDLDHHDHFHNSMKEYIHKNGLENEFKDFYMDKLNFKRGQETMKTKEDEKKDQEKKDEEKKDQEKKDQEKKDQEKKDNENESTKDPADAQMILVAIQELKATVSSLAESVASLMNERNQQDGDEKKDDDEDKDDEGKEDDEKKGDDEGKEDEDKEDDEKKGDHEDKDDDEKSVEELSEEEALKQLEAVTDELEQLEAS